MPFRTCVSVRPMHQRHSSLLLMPNATHARTSRATSIQRRPLTFFKPHLRSDTHTCCTRCCHHFYTRHTTPLTLHITAARTACKAWLVDRHLLHTAAPTRCTATHCVLDCLTCSFCATTRYSFAADSGPVCRTCCYAFAARTCTGSATTFHPHYDICLFDAR